jgi:hypothetical protein
MPPLSAVIAVADHRAAGALIAGSCGESRDERAEGGEEGERYSSYASYFRRLTLPPDVDVDRAEASFKHGVLRIRLPKREAAAHVKRIPVSAEQTASKPIEKGKAA